MELPREGTFADVAEQIPDARDFQLRPDDGGDEKIAIPLDLSLYDLRLYLADGYHLYVEGAITPITATSLQVMTCGWPVLELCHTQCSVSVACMGHDF